MQVGNSLITLTSAIWVLFSFAQALYKWPISSFEACDKNISIARNDTFTIFSPRYPYSFAVGTACRYMVSTPPNYEMEVQCRINFYEVHLLSLFEELILKCCISNHKDTELGCENELFIVSQEADPYFNNVEIFCGITTVHRQSLLQTITIGYISQLKGGYFECEFRSIPQRCDCGWSSVSKIVGGHEAQLHEFPFMAGIVSFSLKRIICGGSIISDRFTLTAAHCVSNPSEINNIALVIGEHDVTTGKDTPYTKLHLIDRIIYHENYNNVSWENDIALVRVQEQMTWSIGVAPICLPFLDRFRNFANQQAEIAGWGTTEFGGALSNTLMKGTVRILSNEYCQNQMDLCTYDDEVDSCQGDSGGPIILNRDRLFLVGIISFGKGCPGIGHNVRVTSYLDWIVTNTEQTFCMKPINLG